MAGLLTRLSGGHQKPSLSLLLINTGRLRITRYFLRQVVCTSGVTLLA